MQSEERYQCDQCDHKASCKVSLRKHIGKTHKMIPQLDGLLDEESPADDQKGEDKELQTEPELHEEILKCPDFWQKTNFARNFSHQKNTKPTVVEFIF